MNQIIYVVSNLVILVESSYLTQGEYLSNNEAVFERYKIETLYCPHRYPIPNPFVPFVGKLGLVKTLIKEIFEYNIRLVKSTYRETLMSRPCIYGVFSGPLGGFKPRKDLCVGCMRCVQEFPGFCDVQRNPKFKKFGDSYWMSEDPDKMSESPFATIWYEAETGKILVKGMGYKGIFGGTGWDSMWTDMSEIVRPTRDGVYGREFISTQVDIGSRFDKVRFNPLIQNKKSFSIPIPIIFDKFPTNLSSESIIKSVQSAADEIKTKYITDVRSIHILKDQRPKGYILHLSEKADLNLDRYIQNASAVCLEDSMLDSFQEFKMYLNEKPILLRIRIEDGVYEKIKNYIELGIDGVILESDYHGMTYDKKPKFIKSKLLEIHQKLVQEGLRDKITIIASGGIILAEHIPKAIMCGADLVVINTSLLVALQVKFQTECKFPHLGEISDNEFNHEWGKQRLTNLMGSWYNQIIEIMSAMGIREIRRLRGDIGRAMFQEELEEVAFGDIKRID